MAQDHLYSISVFPSFFFLLFSFIHPRWVPRSLACSLACVLTQQTSLRFSVRLCLCPGEDRGWRPARSSPWGGGQGSGAMWDPGKRRWILLGKIKAHLLEGGTFTGPHKGEEKVPLPLTTSCPVPTAGKGEDSGPTPRGEESGPRPPLGRRLNIEVQLH